MNVEDKEFVKMLLYEKTNEEVLQEIDYIDNSNIIHTYLNNYNWNDGFEIPKKLLLNPYCELGTALRSFYLAEGMIYLEDKNAVREYDSIEWVEFIHWLYNRIIHGEFKQEHIFFEPPLNKVQLYKIKKVLSIEEEIFVKTLGDVQLDMIL